MNLVPIKKTIAILAATILGSALAFAAPYTAGQKLEAFSAKDQHEQAFTLKPIETRFLLVSHDMETGKKANAALSALGKDYLPGKKAIYVANIHGMPSIGRMFALPKMKKYNHQIILGDDANLIAKYPAQAGKVTVLALSNGVIQTIKYWSPGAENVADYLK